MFKKTLKHRVLAVILALTMVLGMVQAMSVSVFAAEVNPEDTIEEFEIVLVNGTDEGTYQLSITNEAGNEKLYCYTVTEVATLEAANVAVEAINELIGDPIGSNDFQSPDDSYPIEDWDENVATIDIAVGNVLAVYEATLDTEAQAYYLTKVGATAVGFEAIADAKADVLAALADTTKFVATNATVQDDVEDVIEAALADTGITFEIPVDEDDAPDFTKTLATIADAGSITGSVVLTQELVEGVAADLEQGIEAVEEVVVTATVDIDVEIPALKAVDTLEFATDIAKKPVITTGTAIAAPTGFATTVTFKAGEEAIPAKTGEGEDEVVNYTFTDGYIAKKVEGKWVAATGNYEEDADYAIIYAVELNNTILYGWKNAVTCSTGFALADATVDKEANDPKTYVVYELGTSEKNAVSAVEITVADAKKPNTKADTAIALDAGFATVDANAVYTLSNGAICVKVEDAWTPVAEGAKYEAGKEYAIVYDIAIKETAAASNKWAETVTVTDDFELVDDQVIYALAAVEKNTVANVTVALTGNLPALTAENGTYVDANTAGLVTVTAKETAEATSNVAATVTATAVYLDESGETPVWTACEEGFKLAYGTEYGIKYTIALTDTVNYDWAATVAIEADEDYEVDATAKTVIVPLSAVAKKTVAAVTATVDAEKAPTMKSGDTLAIADGYVAFAIEGRATADCAATSKLVVKDANDAWVEATDLVLAVGTTYGVQYTITLNDADLAWAADVAIDEAFAKVSGDATTLTYVYTLPAVTYKVLSTVELSVDADKVPAIKPDVKYLNANINASIVEDSAAYGVKAVILVKAVYETNEDGETVFSHWEAATDDIKDDATLVSGEEYALLVQVESAGDYVYGEEITAEGFTYVTKEDNIAVFLYELGKCEILPVDRVTATVDVVEKTIAAIELDEDEYAKLGNALDVEALVEAAIVKAKEVKGTFINDEVTVDYTAIVKKAATIRADGSITGKIVVSAGDKEAAEEAEDATLYNEQEVALTPIALKMLNKTDADKIAVAKEVINEALDKIVAKNDTVPADIEGPVNAAIADAKAKDDLLSGIVLVYDIKATEEADEDKAGKIPVEITIQLKNAGTTIASDKIVRDLVIAEVKTNAEKVAAVKTALEAALATVTKVTNESEAADSETKIVTVLAAAEAEAKKADYQLADVTVNYTDVEFTAATKLVAGSVEGKVVITAGTGETAATAEIAIDKAIAILEKTPAETVAVVKGLAQTRLDAVTEPSNSTDLEALVTKVITDAIALDASLENVTVEYDITKVDATKIAYGSITGEIKLSMLEKAAVEDDPATEDVDEEAEAVYAEATIEIDKEIAILEKEDGDDIVDVVASDVVTPALAEIEVRAATITKAAIQEVLEAAIEDLVDVDDTFDGVEVDCTALVIADAEIGEAGSVTGKVKVTLDGKDEAGSDVTYEAEATANIAIAALKTADAKALELKAVIEEAIDSIELVVNDEFVVEDEELAKKAVEGSEVVEVIKDAVAKAIEEDYQLGLSDIEIVYTGIDAVDANNPAIKGVTYVAATDAKAGSVTGNVVIKATTPGAEDDETTTEEDESTPDVVKKTVIPVNKSIAILEKDEARILEIVTGIAQDLIDAYANDGVAVEDELLAVTNDVDFEALINAKLEAAIALDPTLEAVTVTYDIEKEVATLRAAGSIEGEIKLSILVKEAVADDPETEDDEAAEAEYATETIDVEKIIPMLEKTPAQKVAVVKEIIAETVAKAPLTNNVDIADLVEDAVAVAKANDATLVKVTINTEDVEKDDATEEEKGTITGDITIELIVKDSYVNGEGVTVPAEKVTETYTVNLEIPMLLNAEQRVAAVKAAINAAIDEADIENALITKAEDAELTGLEALVAEAFEETVADDYQLEDVVVDVEIIDEITPEADDEEDETPAPIPMSYVATKYAEGKITATITITDGEGEDAEEDEIELSLVIPVLEKTEQETIDRVLEIVEDTVEDAKFVATNTTDLQAVVTKAINDVKAYDAELNEVTVLFDLSKKNSTQEADGAITGTITLNLYKAAVEDDKETEDVNEAKAEIDLTASYTVNKAIARLMTDAEKIAEIEAVVNEALADIEYSNTTSIVTIVKPLVDKAIAANKQLSTVKVAYDIEKVEATIKTPGSIKGAIVITSNDAVETVEIDEVLEILKKTNEEIATLAAEYVDAAIKDVNLTSSINAATITADIENAAKKALADAKELDASLEKVEFVESDLEVKVATEEAAGSVEGTVTIKLVVTPATAGLAEKAIKKEIAVDLTIAKLLNVAETLAEAKKVAEDAIADLEATNDTDVKALVSEALTDAELDDIAVTGSLEIEPATTSAAGYIFGTLTLTYRGSSVTVDIDKDIEKLVSYEDKLAAAKTAVEALLETYVAANITDTETIKDAIVAELTELELEDIVSVEVVIDAENSEAETEDKEGKLALTVTLAVNDTELEEEIEAEVRVHTHEFSDVWSGDDTYHWHICACGDADKKVEHTLTWTITKAATAEAEGEMTGICSVCKQTVKKAIPAIGAGTDGNITAGAGTENAFGGALTNAGDVLTKVTLSDADMAAIEAGKDISFVLEVKDITATVSADDKVLIKDVIGTKTLAKYIDVSLFKQIEDGAKTEITETNGKISVSIVVPEADRNTDETKVRNYVIAKLHNGVASVITPAYDEATFTLTFETDEFSTYALAYSDTDAAAATPELVIKDAESSIIIDTNKTFDGEYDGVIYGFTPVNGGADKISSADFYTALLEVNNGGSLEVVKTPYIARPASWGTGTVLNVKDADGEVIKSYVVVIFGDVDGDGAISTGDVSNALNEVKVAGTLPEIRRMAANVTIPGRGLDADDLHTVGTDDLSDLLAQVKVPTKLDFANIAEKHSQFNVYYQ